MGKNIGVLDRLVRLVIGALLLGLYGAVDPPLKYLTLIGLLPVGTALLGRCPLYSALGVSTIRRRHEQPR